MTDRERELLLLVAAIVQAQFPQEWRQLLHDLDVPDPLNPPGVEKMNSFEPP